MFLTKEQILKAKDLKEETVNVPEWGGSVKVRSLTGRERDEFERDVFNDGDKSTWENFRAKLVALTIVDEKGERIFTSSDVHALGNKSALALDKIFSVSQRLSGLRKEDVEEMTKNSGSQSKGSDSN